MKKVLYIIDDVNYISGAQKVTLFQMRQMQMEMEVFMLTLVRPKETIEFLDSAHILSSELWGKTELYAQSLRNVLKHRKYNPIQKLSRILYSVSIRLGISEMYFEKVISKNLCNEMERFDDVIVVSEASKMRKIVSKLKRPQKIQWIHTDYFRWSNFSEWSRAVTKHDAKTYQNFDRLVVLSEYCKQGVQKKISSVTDKVVVIPNLIDGQRIVELSKEKIQINIPENCLTLITVARIDREKRIDLILKVAKKMQEHQVFRWYIVGDGPQREILEKRKEQLGLGQNVIFLGYLDNPYSVMKCCDVFVLLSEYEGTPVTIDEAMVLGLNIVAPRIGGIPEQVEGYASCRLFDSYESLEKYFNRRERGIEKFDFKKINEERIRKIKNIL